MVTATGLLQKGDTIQNIHTGSKWDVIERLGNDQIYAVRLKPHNPNDLKYSDRARGYMLMTETPYWLKNGWKILPKS